MYPVLEIVRNEVKSVEPEIVAALIAGAITINIAIIKGVEYVGNKKTIPQLFTRVAVLEARVNVHLETGPQLNIELNEINKEITIVKQDIASIKGKIFS